MTDDPKKQDAIFLVEEFGVKPHGAAQLVHGPGESADQLARELLREEHEADPLAEVPVPGSGKDPDHEETGIEDLEKPIDHSDSAPT